MICLCLTLSAAAQQVFTLKGVIFIKSTQGRVSKAVINNVTRNTIVTSDDLGSFNIEAAVGDSILFRKVDYAQQSLKVSNTNGLSIYLQPIISLKTVTIKDYSERQELNATLNNYRKVGQYYTLKPSALAVVTSPLTGLYEMFGKTPGRARKFQEYSKQELESQAVSKRYNKALVKQVTNMTDIDLDEFMMVFTPSYEDVKSWSDYDIIKYIKRSYDYFKENRDSLKVEKLQ